jgi:tetratricopeptide (TPR) repeat protein
MPASEQLLTNLRQTLLSCAPVDSDNGLRALFVDPRLQHWRHLLPEGDSPAGRVDGLLVLLHDRQDEHEASALALFLEVAAEQLSPDDACQQQLLDLVEPVRSAAAASPDGLFPQLEAARRRSGDVYDLSGDFRGAVINIQSTIVQAAEVRELEGLPPEPGDPPFQGLQPFTAADADRFFGRERLTARLANRLQPAQPHQARFLAVIGASGSGKSSLVRAGLIPALRRGQRLADGSLPPSGSASWTVRIFTPTAHPLESLATALLADSETLSELAALTRELEAEPDTLGLAARRLVSQEESGHLLLVVDQFEELFTQCRQPEERQAFVDALLAAVDPARGRPVTLLIVLRADFYAHCAQYDGLRELLSQQQEYIGAMSRAELFDAIVKPAALGEWRIQEGLVELMLDEVGNEPGALPLLSHALLETWQRRRGRTMTLSGYNEAGGVRGAIAQTAETVFSQRLTTGQQQVARAIFLRLTEVGEVHGDEGATPDTRRRVPLAELLSSAHDDETVAAVLEILSSARLVTTGLLPAANTRVVEVAHEALIREWPTLRQWLDANREHLLRQRDLTDAAYTWESLGRDDGALFRGARLEQALAWLAEAPEPLSLLEQEFVAASQALAAREAAERRRLARAALVQRALAFVAVALIAVIVFLVARQAGWFLGPMDGFFNIAVANFLVVDEAGALVDASSAAGEQLGDWAFAALENEFAANESLQIRRVTLGEVRAAQAGPAPGGAFAGLETPAGLAARVNAHMVVYGVIEQPQSRFSRFSLQFYLAPRLDYTFAELEGQHSLGDPLPFAPEDLALARPQLEAEAAATGHIALGLIQELLHEPEEALASFQAAADAVSRSQQERPVVHFLIGQQYLYLAEDDQRAVDQRADLEEAAASLERALALDPAYTQAQTVLGGVYNFHAQLLLQQDGGSPEPAVVAEAIALAAQARDTYAAALQSDQERPGDRSARLPLAGIAHLGRGNSLRVLSFAHYLQSDLPQALDLAEQSLAALEQAEQALTGTTDHRLLAQTYEARGLAEYWNAFLHDNDPAGYRRAAAYFQKCVAQAAELPLDRFLQEDIVAQRCTPGLAEAEGRLGEAP